MSQIVLVDRNQRVGRHDVGKASVLVLPVGLGNKRPDAFPRDFKRALSAGQIGRVVERG